MRKVMIKCFSIAPGSIDGAQAYCGTIGEYKEFPYLFVDRDSYATNMEINSGFYFDDKMIHNFHIGKYCSIANYSLFLFHMEHDYKSVTTGEARFLSSYNKIARSKQRIKSQILIQNDVWMGVRTMVLPGVTIHDGAVVGAGALVTKDVPPYAIVGGVPAEVIGYRFSDNEIRDMLTISWWNWSAEKLEKNKKDFLLPAAEFVGKYIEPAREEWAAVYSLVQQRERPTILLIPDFDLPCPCWPRVLDEYFSRSRADSELIIYLGGDGMNESDATVVIGYLQEYADSDATVVLQTEPVDDERILFAMCDYYVSTRAYKTIERSCYCDRLGVSIIPGADYPIFDGIEFKYKENLCDRSRGRLIEDKGI
jgi:virginiamycin A acetyltransferase